jgi:hypothetical protein
MQLKQTGDGDRSALGAPISEHPAAEQERQRRWQAQAGFATQALLRLVRTQQDLVRVTQKHLRWRQSRIR